MSGERISRSHSAGYVRIYRPNHPRAASNGYVYEHVLIVERALGHALPDKAEVHHVDGKPDQNRGSNLVACEDDAYHKLLHRRARAYRATGNPHATRCDRSCGRWVLPGEPGTYWYRRRGLFYARHRQCAAIKERQRLKRWAAHA